MYRIPDDLDLSIAIGEFTTQINVGQFDLHFSFGKVDFTVESQIDLVRNGEVVGRWVGGKWPDAQFFDIINEKIVKYEVPNDQQIVLSFENGIQMHLNDDSDQYECLHIFVKDNPDRSWII